MAKIIQGNSNLYCAIIGSKLVGKFIAEIAVAELVVARVNIVKQSFCWTTFNLT